jgi:hypothetical protein
MVINGKRSRYPSKEDISKCLFEETRNILSSWLDYPPRTSISRCQGAFVETLMKVTSNSDILLMDAAWKAYLYPRARLFGNSKMKVIQDYHMDKLIETLSAHPIASTYSQEREIIQKIAALHKPSGLWNPEPIIDHTGEAGDHLTSFLLALTPIISHPSPSKKDTPLIHRAKTNLDFFSPYRNLCPSRLRALQSGGPFQTEYMKTRSGFFSALIYRGITFATPSVYGVHMNRFADLQAWNVHYNSVITKDRDYFCNIAGYGVPNRTQTIANVTKYWRASAIWEPYLQQGFKSFTAFWEFLMISKEG